MPRHRCGALLVALLTAVLLPSPASAWGFAAHRYIMRRAIDLLPAGVQPFFVQHRDELVLRVVDPDLWRNVGWQDDPNHFINLDSPEFGPYPFAGLPREYGAAIEKFGMVAMTRHGMLPWRIAEESGNLRRAFEGFTRGNPYGTSDAVLLAAVASHYLQDAYQPLHAANNYDGQLTGQRGLHARFERDLMEKFESRLTVTPRAPGAITSVRDAAFDAALASYQQMDRLLRADREAVANRDAYDDVYFEAFFQSVKPMLEERLASAITATASLIVTAWEQAGRPDLKNGEPRPVQRAPKAQPARQAR